MKKYWVKNIERDINPIYQAIRDTAESYVPFGDPLLSELPCPSVALAKEENQIQASLRQWKSIIQPEATSFSFLATAGY